jgi:hypothetical protein
VGENPGIVDALLMSDEAIAISQFTSANSIFDYGLQTALVNFSSSFSITHNLEVTVV